MPHESQEAPAIRAGAVLLAAGQSTRMGTAKTLLDFGGIPLVRHAALQVLEAGYDPVIVVVSHPSEAIARALTGLPLRVVINDRAHEGIGTSTRLLTLAPDEGCKGVIRELSDQALFLDCADAAIDIDTREDYERVRARMLR